MAADSTITKKIVHEFNKTMFNTSAKNYFEPIWTHILPNGLVGKNHAVIHDIRREQENVITFFLRPGKKWKGFKSGQFVEIGLEINGVQFKRIFSISSNQELYKESGLITISVKKQEEGKVTPWMFEHLSVGDRLSLSSAMGEFVFEPTQAARENNQEMLFIAGGTGITPMMSIIHDVAKSRNRKIHLLYFSRRQHLFEMELQELSKQYEHINVRLIDSSKEGRISEKHLNELDLDFSQCQSYLCGPSGMLQSTMELLVKKDVSDEHIKSEHFHPFVIDEMDDENVMPGKVLLEKRNNRAIESSGKEAILSLIEKEQIKMKSGCRMGICYQCQCEKMSGVVYNKKTKQYSDTGREVIQICVSIPVGDVTMNI